MDYNGDLLFAIDGTGGAMATLSAEIIYANSEPLAEVPVSFSCTDSEGNSDGACSAPTDIYGVASCSPVDDLLPDIYTIMVESKIGCPAAPSEALLVVYDPDVPRATDGGFILPDAENTLPAETLKDKANFGFIVRIDKNKAAAGNLEFQYRTAGINLKS
jgi:hypothetical protein